MTTSNKILQELEDFSKVLEERQQFSQGLRQQIEQQKQELEQLPLMRALLDGDIALPIEIQLLAHAFFHIDQQAADTIARLTSGKKGEEKGGNEEQMAGEKLPKSNRIRPGVKKIRG